MNNTKNKIAFAISIAIVSGAYAENKLPSVEVVSRPIIEEVAIDEFAGVTAVIKDDQIRDQNAADIASALRRTPGVQISRYNPVGSFGGDQGGAVFIRGMGLSRPGSEIKTYIDGVPFYMPVWNHPLLDMLPVNGMKSITVHKSPQLQINGNNFASVNLETKDATEEGVVGNARVSAGSFNTVMEQFDIAGKSDDFTYSFAQGYAKSDGHRPNADGELANGMGKLGFRINQSWSVGASLLAVSTKAGDPGDSPARYEISANTASAFVNHKHENWSGEFRIYRNAGTTKWLNYTNNGTPGSNGVYDFNMDGVRWKENFMPWKNANILAGLDYDTVTGLSDGTALPSLRITSPHVAINQKIEINSDWAITPSVGIRNYNHSQFTSKTAPHAGVTLSSEKISYFFNNSKGINYPGLEGAALSLAIPGGVFNNLGNWTQLTPEEVDHSEIGAKFTPSEDTQLDVSYFQDSVNNRFVFQPFGSGFFNSGAYKMRGAELSLRQKLSSNWSFFGGYTKLDPSISNLPYTPKNAFTAGLNGNIGLFKVVFDAQYQSETVALTRSRANGSSNTSPVSGFVVANMRLAHPLQALGKKGEVFVMVENLFNKDYAYRSGYPMPGRWGQVGLSTSF